jgi:hypothetical protein
MSDLPISFSPPMVRALLEGRKKMTRRVLKEARGVLGKLPLQDPARTYYPLDTWQCGHEGPWLRLRYRPGDRLYVCEPWQALAEYDHLSPKDIPVGSDILYIADREDSPWDARRRHARFMCRWMSRITLTVTDVRVKRLQDISEADVWAEGLPIFPGPPGYAQAEFATLWDSLRGPGAWETNPWVAAISFTTSKENIDA